MWSVNNFSKCGPPSEKPLSLPLQVHHVNWQDPSLGWVVLLLVTTLINKHGDHKPHYPFHGAQYLVDLLHNRCQLPLEFIARKTLIQNFKQLMTVLYSRWSHLVARVKNCWKEINAWAVIWGNMIVLYFYKLIFKWHPALVTWVRHHKALWGHIGWYSSTMIIKYNF